jgi:hypothetical protein
LISSALDDSEDAGATSSPIASRAEVRIDRLRTG